MRCPRCNFEGELLDGGCARCGYGRMRASSAPLPVLTRPTTPVTTSNPLYAIPQPLLMSNVLRQRRYTLTRQLELPHNQQAQGRAWLATDAQLHKIVVVREIIPSNPSPTSPEREVHVIALRLGQLGQFPGFPRIVDIFSERGSYYIVMEHSEGKSLAQIVQQEGMLPERVIAEYGRQLCRMLEVLSAQQPPVVHGAVNPDNVSISRDGTQATLVHVPLYTPVQPTRSNAQISSGYSAPEQVRGNIEPASDLYGLAATLHHALTEYDPDQHMSFFFPPARRLNPSVSSRMEAILSRALRLSLAQRYATPAEMCNDFDGLLTSSATAGPFERPAIGLSNQPHVIRRQRSGSLTATLFATLAVFVSMLLLGGIVLAIVRGPTMNDSASAAATASAMQTAQVTQLAQMHMALQEEVNLELQSYAKQGIGVSDGRMLFDVFTGRKDASLKAQAAQALRNGDTTTAAALLAKAVALDPIDGEARIYNEDVAIVQNNQPYETVVLGVGIDTTPQALVVGRAILEAAFVAQYEVNEFGLLPHGMQLRILIANAGPNSANATTVAQFIANRITHAGNLDHIIAVAGWLSSATTLRALAIISTMHVPLISQTTLAANVSGEGSRYFFHVNPAYAVQGNTLATIATQQLHAHTLLVLHDPTDANSVSLANAFVIGARTLKANVLDTPQGSITETVTSATNYATVVSSVVANKVDTIFLAGTAVDAVRLAHAIGIALRSNPTNTVLSHLNILGGTALDSSLVLGQGASLEAAIARAYPLEMRRLNFIGFADVNTSKYLNIPPDKQPTFFTEWGGLYQNSFKTLDNAPPPDQNAIMTYDAVSIIGRAAKLISSALTGQAIGDALHAFGSGKILAYQGASGRIVFDDQGNPIDKAIDVLQVVGTVSGNSIQIKQILGTYQ